MVWYLFPFFFWLVGGLISYAAVKDKDRDLANNCLLLGFLMTIFGVVMLLIVLG
jgi:hypothetical protein